MANEETKQNRRKKKPPTDENTVEVVRPSSIDACVGKTGQLLMDRGTAKVTGQSWATEFVAVVVQALQDTHKIAKLTALRTDYVAGCPVTEATLAKSPDFDQNYKAFKDWDDLRPWQVLSKLNVKQAHGLDKHGIILTNSRGRILKSGQHGKFEREIEAMQSLAESRLGSFLPKCYGERELAGGTYIEMEDLLHGLHKGSKAVASMDIKMGVKTWDESASPDKQQRERVKITPGTTAELGYRLVGMDAGREVVKHYDVTARGGLTRAEFKELACLPFFRDTDECPAQVTTGRALGIVISKLTELLEIVEAGYGGVIRAASVFLGRELRPQGRVVVKLIDLAHFTPGDGIDDNLADGLRNLIAVLEEVRSESDAGAEVPPSDQKKLASGQERGGQ
ncbi:Inositol polyphosphate multikinase alpha [Diplonema papillatum]|nr:Inositol polyphosphate multikinase alpha [Diplonema papillatum]